MISTDTMCFIRALICVCAAFSIPALGEKLCVPFTETCGPIAPAPPHSYVSHVEVVDQIYNTTHYVEEYYDEYRQLVAIMEKTSEIEVHSIFYYEINTAVIIEKRIGTEDGSRTECHVAAITRETPWMVGYSRNGSSAFVLSPSQALLFGGDYKYSYMDGSPERGVPCHRWDACIETPLYDGTFYAEYYWSDSTKLHDLHDFTSEHPVAMKLTGSISPQQGSLEPIQVLNWYNFGFFDNSPNWDEHNWVFEIPSNIYCSGLPDVKKPPTRLSSTFSNRVEGVFQLSVDEDAEVMQSYENWYDFERQLVRFDAIPVPAMEEWDIGGFNELTIIQDFRAGVEYIIDKSLGNCSTIPIPKNSFDAITDPSGKISLKNPLILFGLGQVTNLTYYGKKYARDLPCDVWIGHLDVQIDNYTLSDAVNYELYFLQSGWHEDSGAENPSDEKYPEPILVKIQQDISVDEAPFINEYINFEQNMFKYEETRPEMTVFDITPCFAGHEQIRRFQVAFPGKFRDDFDHDPYGFTKYVHDGLASDLFIPVIRIQHLQVEYNKWDRNLYAEFTIVDRPEVPGMEFPGEVGASLDATVKLLTKMVNEGHLYVVLYNPDYVTPSHTKIMVAYPNSLQEMFEDECTPMLFADQKTSDEKTEESSHLTQHLGKERLADGNTIPRISYIEDVHMSPLLRIVDNNSTLDDPKTYSPGAMAGMGIGMFVLGMILGSVIVLATLKKLPIPEKIEMFSFKK